MKNEKMNKTGYKTGFAVLLFYALMFYTLANGSASADWRERMAASQPLSAAASAVLGHEIFVLGDGGLSGAQKFFEAYDVRGDGWRPLPPLPVDRSHAALAADGDRLYVTGGVNMDKGVRSDGLWMFSPQKSQWYQLPPMPQPRSHHVAVILDPYLYVIGGAGAGARQIYKYHLYQSIWEIGEQDLPVAARQMAGAVSGRHIILAGGLGEGGQILDRVQIYDTESGKWEAGQPLPAARSGGALARLNDGLHYVGGYSLRPDQTHGTHFHLPVNGNQWQYATALPTPRHHAAVGVVDNQLVLIGGSIGVGFYAAFTKTDQVSLFMP